MTISRSHLIVSSPFKNRFCRSSRGNEAHFPGNQHGFESLMTSAGAFWILKPLRAHLETAIGARAVPARSTSLGRGGLEHSAAFRPAILLRTGTVRGPVVVPRSPSLLAGKRTPLLDRLIT